MRIVIVGAGVAGLGIGWRLLQAGCAVTVLDRAQPAGGASWAAAGMLAVSAELEDAAEPEIALALSANRMWPDFAAELEAASGRSVAFARPGSLLLAHDGPALEVLRARAGEGQQILDVDGIRLIAPMLNPMAGALWAPSEGQVDNRLLGEALAVAFLKAGGRLIPNEAAVTIERRGGSATAVLTPYARYGADAFVIAAGAWSGLLDDIPITPVKGEMIALTPPDRAALPGPVIWGNGVYCVPRPHQGEQGRLLVGATVQETGFDTSLTTAARDHLRSRAQALMPLLKNWKLSDHWAGLRPKSPDGLPLLGPAKTGKLFVAGGQYRNGILFAPAIAQMMADLVLGKGVIVPAFDPRRFA
ncbi:MAG TPA: glycine oxidase ThiO [Rhizomicrobium sp.]|jgi:glycine oxidase